MKISAFSILLLAATTEAISSRALQEEESDIPSLVPTMSPAPTLMEEGSDIPSDIPSDFPSDFYSDVPVDAATMPPAMGGTAPPATQTGTTSPASEPALGGTGLPTILDVTSSSSIVSSCVGLVLTVAGLYL